MPAATAQAVINLLVPRPEMAKLEAPKAIETAGVLASTVPVVEVHT